MLIAPPVPATGELSDVTSIEQFIVNTRLAACNVYGYCVTIANGCRCWCNHWRS
jgi:hypothetical protein